VFINHDHQGDFYYYGIHMALKSLIKFISNTPVMLMLRIGKLTKECRTGFVLTAISEGVYDIMQFESATFEDIQKCFNDPVQKV
jgi:hypothetical protein